MATLPTAVGDQGEGYAAFFAGCPSNVRGSTKVSDSFSWLGAESAKNPWPAAQKLPNRMPAGMEMMNQVSRISDSFIATFLLLLRQGNRLKLNASVWQRCNQYAEGWQARSVGIKKWNRSSAFVDQTQDIVILSQERKFRVCNSHSQSLNGAQKSGAEAPHVLWEVNSVSEVIKCSLSNDRLRFCISLPHRCHFDIFCQRQFRLYNHPLMRYCQACTVQKGRLNQPCKLPAQYQT